MNYYKTQNKITLYDWKFRHVMQLWVDNSVSEKELKNLYGTDYYFSKTDKRQVAQARSKIQLITNK